MSFLLMLPVLLLIPSRGASWPGRSAVAVLIGLVVLAVLYILVLSVVFSALNTIFRTGTYLYATTGQAPTSMDPQLLQSTFHSK